MIVETTFKNLDESEAVERLVEAEAAKLERFYDRITRCRVVIEQPNKHHRRGALYHATVELDVPGDVIVVDQIPSERARIAHSDVPGGDKADECDVAHKYVQVAVQDAFRKAGRRLQDYARRLEGVQKVHETAPLAEVASLGADYGFLLSEDGREVYFHRNSVLNGAFDSLRVGLRVRFVEELGEKGPQATTVTLSHGPIMLSSATDLEESDG